MWRLGNDFLWVRSDKRLGSRTIKWGQSDSSGLTRLRSVVLPPASGLPASVLLRFVNPPTLLPMLLLKMPLLPELDMIAFDLYCESSWSGDCKAWNGDCIGSVDVGS